VTQRASCQTHRCEETSSLPIPLLERTPEEIAARIKGIIEASKDVQDCREVTIRMVGKRLDISGHVLLNNGLRFEDIHRILSEIETNVKRSLHRVTRISVCTEPVGHEDEKFVKLVKQIVGGVPGSRGVHSIHIQEVANKLHVDLDLEVGASMTSSQAHAIASEVKKRLRATCQNVSVIIVHMESASDIISRELQGRGTELKRSIEHEKGITAALESQ